ncbi:zinc finger and SCAN domain-containing protein 2 [Lingula anatina]|uniref:Zinc finger and SCAN domain-containing protein 2 n=1 Tax=Lingula anatina TaxID=7574 RepID=A0A1S3HNQ1_LINAN|nr:zinc finger and SCAN domain-containing protein 2 [Lingula anatina]|eukprot:XP_013387683.1 zinc finger and SCAN domain-containing protein 2 [Lingula anatina]
MGKVRKGKGRFCVAYGCTSSSADKLSFHLFPKSTKAPAIRRQWIAFVKTTRRDFLEPSRYSALCEKHFDVKCYPLKYQLLRNMGKEDQIVLKNLLPDAVPTIHVLTPVNEVAPTESHETASATIKANGDKLLRSAYRKREILRMLQDYETKGQPAEDLGDSHYTEAQDAMDGNENANSSRLVTRGTQLKGMKLPKRLEAEQSRPKSQCKVNNNMKAGFDGLQVMMESSDICTVSGQHNGVKVETGEEADMFSTGSSDHLFGMESEDIEDKNKMPQSRDGFTVPVSFREKRKCIQPERTNSGEVPFRCRYCEARFNIRQIYNGHERTHIGENKPHKCQYCEKSFSLKNLRIKHERTHTGEKPYKCQYCEKGFFIKKYCKQHEMCHTGKKMATHQSYEEKFVKYDHVQKEWIQASENPHERKSPYVILTDISNEHNYTGKVMTENHSKFIQEEPAVMQDETGVSLQSVKTEFPVEDFGTEVSLITIKKEFQAGEITLRTKEQRDFLSEIIVKKEFEDSIAPEVRPEIHPVAMFRNVFADTDL